MGVTGWTPDVIAGMTTPALQFILRKRGRILYPRLRPVLEANLANLDNEPRKDKNGVEQPGQIDRIIENHRIRKAGGQVKETEEDRKKAYAVRILLSEYLGDPDKDEKKKGVQPIPGMSQATARGLMQWVRSGDIDDEMWIALMTAWESICVTAQSKEG